MNAMKVNFETVFAKVAEPLKEYLEVHKISHKLTVESVLFFNENFKFTLYVNQEQLDTICKLIEKLYDKVGERI